MYSIICPHCSFDNEIDIIGFDINSIIDIVNLPCESCDEMIHVDFNKLKDDKKRSSK